MISVWYGKNRLLIKGLQKSMKEHSVIYASVYTMILFGVETLKRINEYNFEAYEVGEYISIVLDKYARKTSKKVLKTMFDTLCILSKQFPDNIKIEVEYEKENICS